MIAAGRVIAQNFTLGRVLAYGGMGSVWMAHDQRLDRPVAIKFMNPDAPATASARARFEREARAAAKLQSPHVVQIHSHGHDAGALYIVMELLEGEDLDDRLTREGRLSVVATFDVLRQVGKALAVAHAAGIVHRDLKPANIFLSRTGEDEVLKLLDFGVAKVVSSDDEVSRTGDVFGSPHYLSPEQARGRREVDHRTDLWSLGVVLFRTLTGATPYDGSWIGEIIDGICSGKVPSACALVPELPADLDVFFQRALARNPDDRFQSAKEMVAAFAEAAGISAVAATTDPPPASGDAPLVAAPGADVPTVAAVPAALAGRKELEDTPAHGSRTLAPGRGASARVLWASGAAAAIVVGAVGLLLVSRSRSTAPPEPASSADALPVATSAPAPEPPASDAPGSSAAVIAEPSESAPHAPSATPGGRLAGPPGKKPHPSAAPSVAPAGPKRLPLSY